MFLFSFVEDDDDDDEMALGNPVESVLKKQQ